MAKLGSQALRIGRRSEPGRPYLVTFATHGRRPLFAEWDPAQATARCLDSVETWGDARLLAWVLMPDHWHGLVEQGDSLNLSRTVARAKAVSTIALRTMCDVKRPVWGRGFHDRAMRSSDDLRAAARYIVANPLRAGLAERVGDYPFWNAVWLVDASPV